jgi:hypothetical protein
MSSEPTGVKNDVGKNRLDLIPPEAIEALGWVLTHGAEKYGDNNWRGGIKYSRIYGATLRHLTAWAKGEEKDTESALPHLWHALCELAFLVTYEAHPDLDLNDMYSTSRPITYADMYGSDYDSDFDPEASFAPRSVKDLVQGPPEALPPEFDAQLLGEGFHCDTPAPAKRKRIYVSHPIRGKSGTEAEILANVQIAREWGEKLRTTFPAIDWYVPADHDEVVQELLRCRGTVIDRVLEADFAIIRKCDGLLAIPWCTSEGVECEILFAQGHSIPVYRASKIFSVYDFTFDNFVWSL